jgi:hypothetical protein
VGRGTNLMNIARSALIAMLATISWQAFANDPGLPLYQASYSVAWGGVLAGRSEITLTRTDNGDYEYHSATGTAGLASLFSSKTITEDSRFELGSDGPRPERYSYVDADGDDKEVEEIQFDWIKNSADTSERGRQHTTQLTAGVADRFLSQLSVSLDAAAGKLPAEYRILDHREIVSYATRSKPNASLKTEAGEFQELKVVELYNETSHRVLRFWLASQLHYLPVKIEQTDPHKTLTLTLTAISFNPIVPAATSKPAPAATTNP